MEDFSVRIEVAVAQDEEPFEAEEVDLVIRQLRDELLQLDVQRVDIPRSGPPPTGAKGPDGVLLGTLLITGSDPALISAVVETLKSWIGRSLRRTARVEIDGDVLDVKGISGHDQARLIDLWIARHSQVSD